MDRKMDKKITPCECPAAGLCPRHKIEKSNHLYKLCQNHIGYFEMWEVCQGPGQQNVDCDEQLGSEAQHTTQASPQQLPSKIEMAKNYAKAAAAHARSGFQHATTEEQRARLEVCKTCDYYIAEQDQCAKCGCPLKTKSRWKTSFCPIGKW